MNWLKVGLLLIAILVLVAMPSKPPPASPA